MPRGKNHEIITCAAPIEVLDNGVAKKYIRVLKIGKNYLRGHDITVNVTNEDAAKIIAASKEKIGAQDIPIDYDHQLEFSAVQGKGGKAPASGWIKSLSIEKDGIYADVDWTVAANDAIVGKEYRYISPTLMVDKNTLKVVYIKNAGLTNQPSIDGLEVLAASMGNNQNKEDKMDLEALALALGLGKGATFDEVLAKAKETGVAIVAASAAVSAVKENLGIDKDANLETIAASINALKTTKGLKEGEMVVSASAFTAMQSQLLALTASQNAGKIDAALKAGRITPGQKPQYEELFKTNPTLAEQMIAASVPVVTGETTLGGQAPASSAKLSAEELKICASYDLPEEAFLAERNLFLASGGGE